MTYEYSCTNATCLNRFDVIKSVKDMDVNEFCPICAHGAERKFVPSRVYFSKTSVEHAEYNPGLGCVVKNRQHREELAKQRGLVEIGNDYSSPEVIHKEMDTKREEIREARYDEALKNVQEVS